MCPALLGMAEVFLCTTDSGKGVVLMGHATPTLPHNNNTEFGPRWIGLITGMLDNFQTFLLTYITQVTLDAPLL